MNKLISIIINCYNGERYLEECLDSIVQQTYKDYEVIFWDNQSTDNSQKIFNKYNNKKFKYFRSSKFTNLSEARNLAINKCQGRYITFLDVDDFWFPKKLETQIEAIKKNKAALVFSNFFIIDQKTKKKKIYRNKKFPKQNILNSLFDKYYIGLLTVMYDKTMIGNLSFNPDYHIIGDFDLTINISEKYNISGLDTPLACYRLHSNNETKNKTLKYNLELNKWYKKNFYRFRNYQNYKKINIIIKYNFVKYFLSKCKFCKALKYLKSLIYLHY